MLQKPQEKWTSNWQHQYAQDVGPQLTQLTALKALPVVKHASIAKMSAISFS